MRTENERSTHIERRETWNLLNDSVESDAFPLAFLQGAGLGATPVAETDVDAGSYLVVLQRETCRTTRVPIFLRRDERREVQVRLYTDAEIGPDMVYVPSGSAVLGGDPMAFSPEPERTVSLPDFFISRHEVTVDEYFRFLNDPAIRAEIAAAPGGEAGSPLLPVNSEARGRPRFYETVVQDRITRFTPSDVAERVQRYLPRTAAERYVAWLNDREAKAGGGRVFVLPSADEIEKAARGADGRRFPWGNGFDLSLVSSYRSAGAGELRNLAFPTDASPYDARDLAGSVCEWTRDNESLGFASPSSAKHAEARLKGGSYYDDLEPYFRIGGHTRERVREGSYRIGFRVVAYRRAPDSTKDHASIASRPRPREAGLAFSDDPYAVPRWFSDVDGDARADYCRLKGALPPEGDGLAIGCLLFRESMTFEAEVMISGVELGEPGNRWFADVDGDRRADFCRLIETAPGASRRFEVRCLLSGSSGFAGEVSSGAVEPGLNGNRWLADVDGDGRADFCRLVPLVEPGRERLGLRCLLSTGVGFLREIEIGALDVGLEDARWFADVNGDRRADFCRFLSDETGVRIQCLLASKEGFQEERPVRTPRPVGTGRDGNCWWVDMNGDGLVDFVQVEAMRWSPERFQVLVNCLYLGKAGDGEERMHAAPE